MQEKPSSLQDQFLTAAQKARTPVAIYLVNGIRLIGRVESFDANVVLLKSEVSQLVYKHAIATVVPTERIDALIDEAVPRRQSGLNSPSNSRQRSCDSAV